ncbi:flavin-containing amine oxidoreductase-domain containing protein [Dichotomocladium elegans]|nr:flavin-containing amine oxidoreductase-domain containing protein [Dichotomocladium elegans]
MTRALPLLLVLAAALLRHMARSASVAGIDTSIRLLPITVDEEDLCADSLVNFYVDYGSHDSFCKDVIDHGGTRLAFGFGDCHSERIQTAIGSADLVVVARKGKNAWPTKFVWAIPADAREEGCLLATDHRGYLVAKSRSLVIHRRRMSKRGHPELGNMHFDAVQFHKTQMTKRDRIHASDKSESIGIVGAGMSGLFSALLLEQAGVHNYQILEASNRLGGQNGTTSLYGRKNSTTYQEMGPMRLPVQWTLNNKTLPIKDHEIVFLMAKELNQLNHNNEDYKIDFIEWIQSSNNNLVYKNKVRLSNGKVPTKGDIAANPSLMNDRVGVIEDQIAQAYKPFTTPEWFELMSKDLYAAHDRAIREGYDDWSEWGWIHNKLGLSLNATDFATGLDAGNIWEAMYNVFVFSATAWRTVQGGMTRLAHAYEPLVGNKVQFGIRVGKIGFEDNEKISVQWKEDPYADTFKHKMYDNVIISVPFSLVRSWHLPVGTKDDTLLDLPYTLNQAIHNLDYRPACKVSLEFKTRFWEKYERPILGGCDDTDLLSRNICYPSNNLGSDGPGVMLASYVSGRPGALFDAMTEEQHVARVLEDIKELHGTDVVNEQYTGVYNRLCWSLDPFQAGGWVDAQAGAHKLYMPSYFEMTNGLVFVGEHTDIKEAWISAALESAIRGVVMTLVDRGHIKEAKAIVKKWDAKWMKI